jgi:hypothetical protein
MVVRWLGEAESLVFARKDGRRFVGRWEDDV